MSNISHYTLAREVDSAYTEKWYFTYKKAPSLDSEPVQPEPVQARARLVA